MLAGDLTNPFYKPLWRRIVIVATTALWFGFETIIAGSVFWAILSGAMWAYCSYVFLISWKNPPPTE